MAKVLQLKGIIRNIKHESFVRKSNLKRFAFDSFDVNTALSSGIVEFDEETMLGYSKWVSPKRTRSYPFARIYKTYHLPKRITVIPIIKDEGSRGDNDRINFVTLSWMNLMNVYVILAWYEDARPHPDRDNKITGQQFDNEYVRQRILEIKQNQKSALHWNIMHFERDFEIVYRRAVERYQEIGQQLNCIMHTADSHINILEEYLADGKFSREAFAQASLKGSMSAAKREAVTLHELEYLGDGDKAYFELENLLGGKYHLTADEIYWRDDTLVIQESKNSVKHKLPAWSDIQDGLFKSILFRNIDVLYLDNEPIEFVMHLKLTGAINGILNLPADDLMELQAFSEMNQLTGANHRLLQLLNSEAQVNQGLRIQIAGHQ